MPTRTEAQATFALRFVTDLVSALVLTDALPKKYATTIVGESLRELLEKEPDEDGLHERFREIAATLTAQVELNYADLQARLKREGLDD